MRLQALLKLVPFIKKGLESLINKARAFVDSNQVHRTNSSAFIRFELQTLLVSPQTSFLAAVPHALLLCL